MSQIYKDQFKFLAQVPSGQIRKNKSLRNEDLRLFLP